MTPPLQNVFNLKIKYPPPYTREIWDYNRIESDLINCSIDSFDQQKLFLGKDVHEQVMLIIKESQNIFHNFIPNKLIICDDKDPLSKNDGIKILIKRKNRLYLRQRKSGNFKL